MPVVVGLTRAAAEGAIEKAKLSVGKVVDGFSEKVAAGTVLRASESPGARLKKGTRIDLVVSVGPKPLVITNYQGTPYDSALAALSAAGFRVVERSAYSKKVAKDLVLRQDPRSGRGEPGDTITLTRSLGAKVATVPDVQRMALPAAKKLMRQAGFKTKVQPVGVNRNGVGICDLQQPGCAYGGTARVNGHLVRGLTASCAALRPGRVQARCFCTMSNNSRSVRAMPSSRSFSMRCHSLCRGACSATSRTPHTSQPTVPPGISVMSVSVPPRARAVNRAHRSPL